MPNIPPAAQPTRKIFDPWNSSSTGHQYDQNRMSGSTSWRESRTHKLYAQFADVTRSGGKRLADEVGAGSLAWRKDGRKENGGWDESSIRGARGRAGMKGDEAARTGDLGSWLRGNGLRGGVVRELRRDREETEAIVREAEEEMRKRRRVEVGKEEEARRWKVEREGEERHWIETVGTEGGLRWEDLPEELLRPTTARSTVVKEEEEDEEERAEVGQERLRMEVPALTVAPTPTDAGTYGEAKEEPSRLFESCVFYINGCTMPLISDHKLKYMICQHGGQTSISLRRRTVTHVILGTPKGKCGLVGGLAGAKIQKEIRTVRGKGVKFVVVEWVLESVKAGKRLPEARFSNTLTTPSGIHSVYDVFRQRKPSSSHGHAHKEGIGRK